MVSLPRGYSLISGAEAEFELNKISTARWSAVMRKLSTDCQLAEMSVPSATEVFTMNPTSPRISEPAFHAKRTSFRNKRTLARARNAQVIPKKKKNLVASFFSNLVFVARFCATGLQQELTRGPTTRGMSGQCIIIFVAPA